MSSLIILQLFDLDYSLQIRIGINVIPNPDFPDLPILTATLVLSLRSNIFTFYYRVVYHVNAKF